MATQYFKLDKINKKILSTLQENARISNLDLAEKVHLSPSACLKRTKKLEESGLIRRYTLNMDISKMCATVTMICNIKLSDNRSSHGAGNFEMAIKSEPSAVECFKVGGEIDYIVQFICNDIQHFEAVTDKLLDMEIGVERITSHVVISTPKPFVTYPLETLLWKPEEDEPRD